MMNEQLCWTCTKATGGCDWSNFLKPVKGWNVIEYTRKSGDTGMRITFCPEYEKEEEV